MWFLYWPIKQDKFVVQFVAICAEAPGQPKNIPTPWCQCALLKQWINDWLNNYWFNRDGLAWFYCVLVDGVPRPEWERSVWHRLQDWLFNLVLKCCWYWTGGGDRSVWDTRHRLWRLARLRLHAGLYWEYCGQTAICQLLVLKCFHLGCFASRWRQSNAPLK